MSGALLVATAWTQTESGWRIDTFAGLPKSGDGGPAVEARLDFPDGVAVDGTGNLYIADRNNHRIRVLTPISAGERTPLLEGIRGLIPLSQR